MSASFCLKICIYFFLIYQISVTLYTQMFFPPPPLHAPSVSQFWLRYLPHPCLSVYGKQVGEQSRQLKRAVPQNSSIKIKFMLWGMASASSIIQWKISENTPGTRLGPCGSNRTLSEKRKNKLGLKSHTQGQLYFGLGLELVRVVRLGLGYIGLGLVWNKGKNLGPDKHWGLVWEGGWYGPYYSATLWPYLAS